MAATADSRRITAGSMAGAADAVRYLLEEAEEAMQLTLKEIRKLDPPRYLTDQEAAQAMEKRWERRGPVQEVQKR